MSVSCDRVQCEHRKEAARGYFVCRCGHGYECGGGDIVISKSGHCKNYERKTPIVSKIVPGDTPSPPVY